MSSKVILASRARMNAILGESHVSLPLSETHFRSASDVPKQIQMREYEFPDSVPTTCDVLDVRDGKILTTAAPSSRPEYMSLMEQRQRGSNQ